MSPTVPQLDSIPLAPDHPKRIVQAWGLSLLLHFALMTGIIALFLSVNRPAEDLGRKGGIVLAMVEVPDRETKYFSDSIPQLELELDSEDQNQESSAKANAADQSLVESTQPLFAENRSATAAPTATPVVDVGQMLSTSGGTGLNLRPEMSQADLLKLAEEQAWVAARKPKGEPIALSVFGSEPFSGRKFAFLLDQSDSMGSGGLGVLDASKSELDREIAKLLDYHEFQIVAYNDRTSMIGKRRLLPATEPNKRLVAGFVDGLVAVGGTEHRGGLMVALGLEPDVIVLISDGGEPALTQQELSLVAGLARGKTQIHCLQFGSGATPAARSDFMQELATLTDGTFRYIDVSRWESNKN